MNDQKIIDIVGKVPPPIGGVNIHVKRLTEFLNRENYRFNFFRLSIKDIFKLLLRGNTIHLHTSNVYVRLAFSFFYGIILNNNLIITYHGTVGRFSLIKNFIDGLSIRWCTYPIVLNNISFSRANNLNANTKLFSAFIPPYSSIYPISLTTDKLIRQIRNQFDNVFCTNAYGYTFDINGREIYGILSLSKIIKKYPSFALIISDPNNGYSETILRNNDEGNNVFRINYPHDFVDILKLSGQLQPMVILYLCMKLCITLNL